jgi:hypothetical protein
MEDIVFQVTANTLTEYLNFDPARRDDLDQLDALIRKSAPALKRYFHQGTPAGDAGMRMKMMGYGKFRYSIKSGKSTDWPVVGLALQKSYISLYFSITADGKPILDRYKGRLGEKRSGRNNFSFVKFDDLKLDAVADLLARSAEIFGEDPENPVRYREG